MNKMERNEIEQLVLQMGKCWYHHLEGSDLIESKEGELFDIIFNKLPVALGYKDTIDFEKRVKDK